MIYSDKQYAISVDQLRKLRDALAARMPGFGFDTNTLLLGSGLAVVTGVVSGVVPGWRAARLPSVAALREVA